MTQRIVHLKGKLKQNQKEIDALVERTKRLLKYESQRSNRPAKPTSHR